MSGYDLDTIRKLRDEAQKKSVELREEIEQKKEQVIALEERVKVYNEFLKGDVPTDYPQIRAWILRQKILKRRAVLQDPPRQRCKREKWFLEQILRFTDSCSPKNPCGDSISTWDMP